MYDHTGTRYTPDVTKNHWKYTVNTADNTAIDTVCFGFMHTQALSSAQ